MKPTLKPPGTKHFKLKGDMLLSNFAFKFNLRRYNTASHVLAAFGGAGPQHACAIARALGRGLHSSRFQLNLSSSVHRVTQLTS